MLETLQQSSCHVSKPRFMVKLGNWWNNKNTNAVFCCLWMQCMVSLHVFPEFSWASRSIYWSFLIIALKQELHQQLIIESRNLKKTTTFYHKLIQQERRNKGTTEIHEFLSPAAPRSSLVCLSCSSVFVGSDTKVMVSKVKLQFEELREKVEFLQSVKKYLQVCATAHAVFPLLGV